MESPLFVLDKEQQEYTAFHEVPCSQCGRLSTIKVDAWAVTVRQQSIGSVTFSPIHFVCEGCDTTNILKPVFTVKLDVVDGGSPTKVRTQ
jgi:hypothetical protein